MFQFSEFFFFFEFGRLGMDERWTFKGLKIRMAMFIVVLLLFIQNLSLCSSLNTEGTYIYIYF